MKASQLASRVRGTRAGEKRAERRAVEGEWDQRRTVCSVESVCFDV